MESTPSPDSITRRDFVLTTSALAASALIGGAATGAAPPPATRPARAKPAATSASPHPFLTPAEEFEDVSRGDPKPFTLKGEALVAARLTPESWRLEVVADPLVNDVVKEPATLAR